MKINEKAKELGITLKELTTILADAGYTYSNGQTLKPDALQFLEIEYSSVVIVPEIKDGFLNAIVVPVKDSFAVITLVVNAKLETKEISRQVFESKVRAYYELNHLVELFEIGR